MSASLDKWSLSKCTDQIEAHLAATGRAAISEAARIGDASRNRNDRANSLCSELKNAAEALSARTASDGALATLLLVTAQQWREAERAAGERLSAGRGDVRSSAADLGAQASRLRSRAEGCRWSVERFGQILAELQLFEEKVHADLQDCSALLDDISAARGELETISTEVAR
jgi:hypothetical protein